MKVLLANKNQETDGPILTICYTNHALDQFLEVNLTLIISTRCINFNINIFFFSISYLQHLLDEKITNIVRLGSRTRSEKIKNFNLEAVCRTRGFCGKLSYQIKEL